MDVRVLMELLSSSSSEDELSDKENLEDVLPEILHHHQKNENYAEHVVPLYTEKEFLEHFKMPREILRVLAIEFQISEYYPKKDTGFARINAEKCLWIFSWYATHEAASYRDVSDRFNVALSTLNIIITNVTYFLSYKSREVITWPTETEQIEIVEKFTNMGFPSVVGCMDGSHVRIDKPQNDPESYLNRKKYYSIQFQAVCDANKKIRDVFIGFPGSVHDARVFHNSPLHETLQEKCNDKVILADSAYPCLRNVLVPYKDNGNLSATEKNFNFKLSHCRIVVEHMFGLLKQKFRQLYHLKLRDETLICHFIRACCVLYNYSIHLHLEEDESEYEQQDPEQQNGFDNYQDQGNIAGHAYRNYIAAVLYNQ